MRGLGVPLALFQLFLMRPQAAFHFVGANLQGTERSLALGCGGEDFFIHFHIDGNIESRLVGVECDMCADHLFKELLKLPHLFFGALL